MFRLKFAEMIDSGGCQPGRSTVQNAGLNVGAIKRSERSRIPAPGSTREAPENLEPSRELLLEFINMWAECKLAVQGYS